MNLKALFHLAHDNPDAIRALCAQHQLDPVVSLGVVKLMLANDGNLASLSAKQKHHYELTIKPLIE